MINRAGQISASIALDMSLYLQQETNHGPWHAALMHLFDWAKLLFNYPAYTLITTYIRMLIKPLYEEIGWQDQGSHLKKFVYFLNTLANI